MTDTEVSRLQELKSSCFSRSTLAYFWSKGATRWSKIGAVQYLEIKEIIMAKCQLDSSSPDSEDIELSIMLSYHLLMDGLSDYLILSIYLRFRSLLQENRLIISKALRANFVVPEFKKFCHVIKELYHECKNVEGGKVCPHRPKTWRSLTLILIISCSCIFSFWFWSYMKLFARLSAQVYDHIPYTASVNPDAFGVALCTTDGQRHLIGDAKAPFLLLSCRYRIVAIAKYVTIWYE